MNDLCPKSTAASMLAIGPRFALRSPTESAPLPSPSSRTIGATMQPAPSTPSTQPHVLALRLRGEKPHQGLRRKNPAPYRVHRRCNSRNALGLRTAEHRNRVRSRCSGEQYDSDLDLYYLRARYYNPATGRFLSRDPLDGNAVDPQSLHKYLYAGGDPVNSIDPTGKGLVEFLFARKTGILNTNAYVRLGFGWNNIIKCIVFRLAIGSAGALIHWHIDLWDYCP